jgi:hypothetical protein
LTTGQTIGGLSLYNEDNILDREAALRIWTEGSAWFSGEADVKGTLSPGKYADLAVLSADYLNVPPAEIRRIHSVLTLVGGTIVYGDGPFESLAPPLPPVSPSWSPAGKFNSPAQRADAGFADPVQRSCHDGCSSGCGVHGHNHAIAWNTPLPVQDLQSFWGALGCSCFAG